MYVASYILASTWSYCTQVARKIASKPSFDAQKETAFVLEPAIHWEAQPYSPGGIRRVSE